MIAIARLATIARLRLAVTLRLCAARRPRAALIRPRLLGLLACGLLCGVAPALAQTPLTADDRLAVSALLLGPKENDVKTCITNALSLNVQAMSARMGQLSDEQLRKRISLASEPPVLRELRERQMAVWRETREPARLAQMEADACLMHVGIKNQLGGAGYTCFGHAGVAARAEYLKWRGKTKEEAYADAVEVIRDQLAPEYLRQIVDQVYAGDMRGDNLLAHRRTFASCMNAIKDKEAPGAAAPAAAPAAPPAAPTGSRP